MVLLLVMTVMAVFALGGCSSPADNPPAGDQSVKSQFKEIKS